MTRSHWTVLLVYSAVFLLHLVNSANVIRPSGNSEPISEIHVEEDNGSASTLDIPRTAIPGLQNQHRIVPSYVELFRSQGHFQKQEFANSKEALVAKQAILNFLHQDLNKILTLATNEPELSALLANLRSEPGYSNILQCQADLAKVFAASEPWSQQMIDAWGKPGSGMLRAQVFFPGNYDECLEVNTGQDFSSQYCLQQYYVQQVGPLVPPNSLVFMLGTCAPSSCQDQDLTQLLNVYLATLRPQNVSAGVIYTGCKHPDQPLSDKAITVIAVLGVFAGVMLLATLYDVLAKQGVWMMLSSRTRTSTIWLSDHHTNDSVTEDKKTHRSEYEPLLDSSKNKPTPSEGKSSPGVSEMLEKLLLSFSVYSNGTKLLSTNTGSGTIECINGIRFISMTWVILGHTYVMGLQGMDNVNEYLEKAYTRWTFQGILSALVSVDTFFALSGLLMTYLVLKELDKKRPGPFFFFKFYFHRFWRLTPPYMLVMMVDITLVKYMSDGPIWPEDGTEQNDCEGTWWTNLLYINNVVKDKEMCMGWSWYLANDMQFFVISPLIFLPLFYFGHIALAIPLAMLVGNSIASGVISQENDLPPNIDITNMQGNDYFNVYYIKPYCRIGPYLVGMMTGYLLYVTECRARIHRVLVILGWIMAWAVGLAVVYGLFHHTNGHPLSTELSALFNALHRIGWGLALCWLIFACANGYGGFINTILSWKGLIPLSRLTYCAYLVHPLVIYFYYFSHRRLFYLDNNSIIFAFLGTLAMSYAVAFVASLAFEAPMLGLEKVLLGDLVGKIRSAFRGNNPVIVEHYPPQTPPQRTTKSQTTM